MEMPKPDAHHEKLDALVGTWNGEETMAPSPWDPNGGKATAVSKARRDLDGLFLVVDYQQHRDGKVTYRGHGVYGWDPADSTYTMYWFDSMGSDPGGPARGKWEGDTLMFQMKSRMGHSRYIYRFKSPTEYDFRIEMSRDGESYQTWLESTYRRA